ncbi:MAG: RsmB/NOP family class I SAM-dependent RNA methyltransferase [Pseudomonadota bacterium]
MKLSVPQLAAAVDALREALPCTHPADAVLRRHFREHPELGARDREFVAELVFGVLRRKRLLEYLVGERATPRRLALAYLMKIGGLNLREFAELASESETKWLAQVKAMPTDALPLAVRADLPDWLVEKLVAFADEHAILELARGMQQPAPLDLRVNTLLAGRDEVLEKFREENIAAVPTPYSPLGVRLADKPALNKHALFVAGKFEVQDEGSQLLGFLLAPKRRDMVVDFCAGAGGKTLLLGALMHSQGRLYAFDVSEKRMHNLKLRLKRSSLSNVHPQLIHNENDLKIKRLAGKIDRVLVDAPCSGLGTLRRNPDLKWRQTPQDIEELKQKQAAILAAAAKLIKPGGRLVYATCSILPEENQEIVEAFLAGHGNFKLLDCAQLLAAQDIALDTGRYLQLLPHLHHTDGFFAAALERNA